MATSIFSLFGEIFVDNEKANKGIDETTKKGSDMGDKLKTGFATAGKAALAVGTAAVAAGTAIFGMANNSAQAADEIDKTRQALGMSVEGYQEWSYVLGQNGADITQMGTAMKTLSTVMDGTSKSGVEAMEALGISFKGMNQEEAFKAAVTALQGVSDETEKARLAQDLFGKKYQDLMPLLNQSAEGTEELTNRAHELGLVLSEDAVTAGVVFGDTLDDLKQSFGAIGTKLGAELMPIITEVMNFIIANMPAIQGAIAALAPVITGLLTTLQPIFEQLVTQLLPPILDMITALLPLFDVIVQAVLPPIMNILTELLPFLVQIADQILPVVVDLITALLPVLMPIIESILPPLLDLLEMLLPPLLQLLDLIIPPLTAVVETLAKVLTGVLGAAFEALRPIVEAITKVFGGLIDYIAGVFTGDWEKAWSGIKDKFSGIWEGIKAAFKAPINWIIQGINAFIRGINKIKIPDWVPLVGGKGFSIGEIPLLARGGEVTSSGAAVVGEAGPELVKLNKGAEVIPLDGGARGGTNITLRIEHFHNERKQDIKELVDEVLEVAEEKLRRKEAVFA